MRYMKTLGAVALAMGVVMASAGTASATLTEAAGDSVDVGDSIHASSEGATSFAGTLTVTCQKSTLNAQVTENGATVARATVNSWTLEECGNHTFSFKNVGTLKFVATGSNTATLYSTGTEMTSLLHSVFLGTIHCIYQTNETNIGTLTGSGHSGNTTATLDINSVSIPRVLTDGACGEHSTWEGSYSFSSPDSLYIDGPTTKTLTSPKGTQVSLGTKIHASSEGATSLTGTITITCQKSTVEGEVTTADAATSTVGGPVNSLTFSECGNHTVTVLKPGSLELHGSGENAGTLTSTGAEITVLLHSVLLKTVHCIYTTNKTDIGTLTDSNTTGATATLDIGSVSIERSPTDGACGEHSTWEGSYSVSSPDSLYID